MRLLISPLWFIAALNGCGSITIENTSACAVNGKLSLGATCANTLGPVTSVQITLEQALDILEARPATGSAPAHPSGVFQSAADYEKDSVEIQEMCRMLGNKCSYAVQQIIMGRQLLLDAAKAASRETMEKAL